MSDLTRAAYARRQIERIVDAWGQLRRGRHLHVGEDPWPIPLDALESLKVEVADMQREIEKHG